MRHSYLTTHWTPIEAYSIILLLDELRDVLMHTYGSDIRDSMRQHVMQQQASTCADCGSDGGGEPPF